MNSALIIVIALTSIASTYTESYTAGEVITPSLLTTAAAICLP